MRNYVTAILLYHLAAETALAANVPTFTQKAAEEYIGKTADEANVGANDIDIQDKGDLIITFGTKYSTDAIAVLKKDCKDPTSNKCQENLKKALGIGSNAKGLSKRMFDPITGVALLVTGVAFIIATIPPLLSRLWKNDPGNLEVIQIKFPQDQKEEIAEWEDVGDSFMYKPPEGEPVTIKLDGPNGKPKNPPSLKKGTDGSLVVAFPGLGSVIQGIFNKVVCKREQSHHLDKRLNVQCLLEYAKALIVAMQVGAPLEDARYINPFKEFPKPKNQLLVESITSDNEFIEKTPLWFGGDEDEELREEEVKKRIADLSSWIAFGYTVGHLVMDGDSMSFPKHFLEEQKEEEKDEEVKRKCYKNPSFCSNCGGNTIDENLETRIGKCAGVNNGALKGCKCFVNYDVINKEFTIDRIKDAYDWIASVANNDTDSEDEDEPICQKQDPKFSETTAPKTAKDGKPSVEEKAAEWCEKMDGKTVTNGGDPEFQFNEYYLSTFWLSASYRNSAAKRLKCGKEAKISKNDCIKSINTAVKKCDPKDGFTHGASMGKGCIFYNVTMDGTKDENNPPWAGDKNKPKCSKSLGDNAEVERTFFEGIWPQFCSQIKDGKALKKTLTNSDFGEADSRKRSPPPHKTQYQDYRFNFEYTGGKDCKMSCNEAFSEMRLACGSAGIGNTKMSEKSSFDTGCGTYSYAIEKKKTDPAVACKSGKMPPSLMGPSCSSCGDVKGGYDRSVFKAAAHQYCYGDYKWTVNTDKKIEAYAEFDFDSGNTDPETKLPAFCSGITKNKDSDSKPDSKKHCKEGSDYASIRVVVVPSEAQNKCGPVQDYKLPTGEECMKKFNAVADQCITGVEERDTGGFFHDKTGKGCFEWWLQGKPYLLT